jgi:hypothetical protein
MQKSLKRAEKRDADYRVALSCGKPWGMDYPFMVNTRKGDSPLFRSIELRQGRAAKVPL